MGVENRMNYTKEELIELKKKYEILAWALVKRNPWFGEKHFKGKPKMLDEYNHIIDLIEDLEELQNERHQKNKRNL